MRPNRLALAIVSLLAFSFVCLGHVTGAAQAQEQPNSREQAQSQPQQNLSKSFGKNPYYFYVEPRGCLALSADGNWMAACVSAREGMLHQRSAVWLLHIPSNQSTVFQSSRSAGGAYCAAFSPNSRVLGLCQTTWFWDLPQGDKGADYAVQLWALPGATEIPGLLPGRNDVEYIAFSPDGNFLASASAVGVPIPPITFKNSELVHLWDRRKGQELKLLTSYRGFVWGIAFSPDSTKLAIAAGKRISLLDVNEREEVHEFRCRKRCRLPSFSPDGKFLAALENNRILGYSSIRVWNMSNGQTLPLQSEGVSKAWWLAFSPIEDALAWVDQEGEAQFIHFTEIPSGRELRKLAFPQGAPSPFFFTPDGKVIIGGGPEPYPVIYMYDATSGSELRHWDLSHSLDNVAASGPPKPEHFPLP